MRNIFQSGNLINVRVELSPWWLLPFDKSHSRLKSGSEWKKRMVVKERIARKFIWHFMMPGMTLFNACGLQVQFLRPQKVNVCFCSVLALHSTIFFARAVSERRINKPHKINSRTTTTSWKWTLISFKRKLKCNATYMNACSFTYSTIFELL